MRSNIHKLKLNNVIKLESATFYRISISLHNTKMRTYYDIFQNVHIDHNLIYSCQIYFKYVKDFSMQYSQLNDQDLI